MKYLALVLCAVGCSESVDATHRDRDAAANGGEAGAHNSGGAAGTAGGSGGKGGGGAGGDRDARTNGGSGGAVVHPEGGPCAPLEGGTGTWSPGFSNDPGQCKTCVESLDAYCTANLPCAPLDEWKCGRYGGVVIETIGGGCGYVKFSYSGDVGDEWGRIYEVSTGKVVYAWNNGRLSSGCTDAVIAGDEPQCASWKTLSCADGGIPTVPGGSDAGADGAAP